MKVIFILANCLILLFSINVCLVYAQPQEGCIYEGRRYPVGTRIGPYVCQPDGSWLRVGRSNSFGSVI